MSVQDLGLFFLGIVVWTFMAGMFFSLTALLIKARSDDIIIWLILGSIVWPILLVLCVYLFATKITKFLYELFE